ncbi:MAG: hypothetical protein H0V29_13535, partial [Thermoleophilaceae bacterium]|nr:hypothetical protein [Thermoleophilaceae bacterium]
MAAGLSLAPERAPAAAAGAVVLTVGVLVTTVRFADTWAAFPRLVVLAAAAAAVFALLWGTPIEAGESPSPWQTALIAALLVLLIGSLGTLADVLGTTAGNSRTLTWLSAIFVVECAWVAHRYRSAVAALFGALAVIVFTVSFVDWVFTPESVTAFRWVLAILSVALLAAAGVRRGDSVGQGAQLANAAGVAAVAVAATFLAGLIQSAFA